MGDVQLLRRQQRRVQVFYRKRTDIVLWGVEEVQGLEVGYRQGVGEGDVRVEAEGVEDAGLQGEEAVVEGGL